MNKTIPYRKAVYAASGLPIKNMQYECTGERLKGRDKLEDRYRKNLAARLTDFVYGFGLSFFNQNDAYYDGNCITDGGICDGVLHMW